MKINNWKYEIKDINDYPSDVKDHRESILSNAVSVANYDLLLSINNNTRVLEIGCGAYSYLQANMENQHNWDAIDVYEYDSRNRKCIATKLGSVHDIPFDSNTFDVVLANQSIEHWFEYGVSLHAGLIEIIRVLKFDGKAYINFPLFLHGHPLFVKGDIDSILNLFADKDCDICSITAYEDSSELDYKGWERCNFPRFYINRIHSPTSSYVAEIVVRKNKESKAMNIKTEKPFKPLKRASSLKRTISHGLDVMIWKVAKKFFKSIK